MSKRTRMRASFHLACVAALLVGGIAQATPPTPPAELEWFDRDAIAKLEPTNGTFRLPLRVAVRDGATDLSIEVRVVRTDAIKPTEVAKSTHRLQAGDNRDRVEIEVPVQKGEDARYEIAIELVGSIDKRRGVLDREVIYQVTEGGRSRLVMPAELRRLDQRQRNERFMERLREAPDRPDIRLLTADTLRVPDELAAKAQAAADRPQLQVRGTGPSEKIRRYVVDRTDAAWSDIDPITVRGRLVYLDFEGTWRPLINASVNLYDDDTFGDEHLGTTASDWNGDWSFTVNNDDGWLANGRDIYYRFNLGNTRWDVHDDDGDQYVWQSAVHDDLSDGTVVDFGNETGTTDATAMQVFGIVNLGWAHITNAGGQDPGYIEVQHPTSSTFHSAGVVNVEASDNDGPDTILHEYGHGLMYRAFGNTSISPGGAHGFDDDLQDPGLAYSEGWATGYMLSLCPDGEYNWHEGATESAGEWPTCTTQNDTGRQIERFSDAGNRVGERNEGRVAAAINDFRDAPDDDNGGTENRGRNGESDANASNRIALTTIYRDSMWGFVHNDFVNFWVTFAGNLSGTTRARADDIMQYNWMSIPVDVSCVASKVTASLEKEPEGLLSGLRSFRDHALKPLPAGRGWIQSYYRHSPELAMLLIGDPEARKSALVIIKHFAELGRAFGTRQALERLLETDPQILPPDVTSAIERISALVEKNGSEELRRELGAFRHELRSFEGMSLSDAVREAESGARGIKKGALQVIRPAPVGPASQEADWALIRKNLPRE